MSLKTNEEWATLYQTAIESLLVNPLQSYTIGGRTFTMMDLEMLQKLYEHYYSLYYQETYGNATYVDLSGRTD